jgi:hypothetical protein
MPVVQLNPNALGGKIKNYNHETPFFIILLVPNFSIGLFFNR